MKVMIANDEGTRTVVLEMEPMSAAFIAAMMLDIAAAAPEGREETAATLRQTAAALQKAVVQCSH